jgi:hypothetical protein
MKTVFLGPFSAVIGGPSAPAAPAPPPLPFPYATAFYQSPVSIINGQSLPENPIQYATPATAQALASIIGAQLAVEYEDQPNTTFSTPQYYLNFQPPAQTGQSLPPLQKINAGLLADEVNKQGFGPENAVWNQLPAGSLALLGPGWTAALQAYVASQTPTAPATPPAV